MFLKKYKSHISMSSIENNKENDEGKDKLLNTEKYIQRLILISMRTKKILEQNDYFLEKDKRKRFDLKNIKLKPTPFQRYQTIKNKKYAIFEKQNNINNKKRAITSYAINHNNRMNKTNTHLLTINNFNFKKPKSLRKNKTHNDNQFYHTHNNFFIKRKNIAINYTDWNETNNYSYNNNNIYNQLQNKNFRVKSNYCTIHINKNSNKSNKVCQTNDSEKTKNNNNNLLKEFPALNIFNYKSKVYKKDEINRFRKEKRKKNLPYINLDEEKFNGLILKF